MIKQEYVKINIDNKSEVYRYSKLGYSPNLGGEIEVSIKHLPKSNPTKILVQCDFCGKDKFVSYKQYNLSTNNGNDIYCCSQKCSRIKNRRTLNEKYGVDNISKLNEIKEKKKQTCLLKHGVYYPQQSDKIREKSNITKFERYGDKNWNNKEKAKNTCLEKYGVEFPQSLGEIKRKQQLTYFNNNYLSIIDNYRYFNIIDYNIDKNMEMICDLNSGHTFKIRYKLFWNRLNNKSTVCTVCNPISKNISGAEIKLLNYIKSIYKSEIITSDKNIISPNELDIYLPDLKLGFEYNGLYWHSDLYKPKNYHLEKTEMCEKRGITLIHIWEDDWLYKSDIVKSMIRNKLGLSNKIMARKCIIKEVNSKDARIFLDKNHLQGHIKSSIRIGLYYNDQLVSLMTFGKTRVPLNSKQTEGEYELYRFCNIQNSLIVGGMSKLLNYFIKKYNPKKIITFVDRSHSIGTSYKNVGFKFLYNTSPGYYWIVDGIRSYRYNWRKDKLVKMGYDKTKSENQIMKELGYNKIYNAGNIKLEYNITEP